MPRAVIRRHLLAAAMLVPALPLARRPAAQPAGAAAAMPGPAAEPSFVVVQRTLAAAMTESAGALRAQHRLRATRALDRARRLARFAGKALGLAPEGIAAFGEALRAVERGRHALQMGRLEEAADILAMGAEALQAARLGASRPVHPGIEAVAEAEGRPVLDAQGEEVGSVEALAPDQAEVLIAAGGMFGIGLFAHTVRLPAQRVLLGREYALALAGKEAFG